MASSTPVHLLVLGAMFLVIAFVSDSIWVLAAGSARSWFERTPRRLPYLGGTGGVEMVRIGARLAVSGRHD